MFYYTRERTEGHLYECLPNHAWAWTVLKGGGCGLPW